MLSNFDNFQNRPKVPNLAPYPIVYISPEIEIIHIYFRQLGALPFTTVMDDSTKLVK